jgi:GNAT superfamily N-acetyltransferase
MEIVDLDPGDPRLELALPVLQELRDKLDRSTFDQVYAAGYPQGLRFTAAFTDDGTAVLGVAGWRILDTTVAIRKLYVDDLVTAAAARSTGVGAALLAELSTRAEAAGCTTIELDSGVHRHGAHRFYLRERMHISSHHFARQLSSDA